MTQLPSYLTEGLDETQAVPVVQPSTVPQPKRRGWFRRNGWGLLGLIPLAATLTAVSIYDGNGYERYWKHEPRVAVAAANDGWVSYADARIRIVEFGPTTVHDFTGKDIVVPQGLRVWRAVLDFDVPKQEVVWGCKVLLEDDKGRLYSFGPDELSSADLDTASCTPDDDKLNRYQTMAFFVTPADSHPTALRIEQSLSFPRYARLGLPG